MSQVKGERARERRASRQQGAAAAVVLAALLLEVVVVAMRGVRIGRNVIVRCQQGHLYSTIWIPGASLKSLRLGRRRFQRCPVGKHWSVVTPVKLSTLSEDELQFARAHKDIRIP